MEAVMKDWRAALPAEVVAEAEELARGTEVLPEGVKALAERIHQARKEKRGLRVKFGIDPTSTDLHIGHAVVFRKLRRFQEFGHQVVIIIGGFTARVGDPSGRSETRPVLTEEQVHANAKTYLEQVGVLLNLQKTEITNNADWLSPLDLEQLLRLAGQVTVNQLLAKEAFGDRLEKGLSLGLHELFYPMLQGYDSVAIKCDIELGGTDQRFNILMGRELQPRYNIQPPQLAMLLPLLEGTDGEKKMSKSYGNHVGIKEPPGDMFGKIMRIPDTMIVRYYDLCTTMTGAEIDKINNAMKAGENPMKFKEQLAHRIVRQYHGDAAGDKAAEEWTRVHGKGEMPEEMNEFVVAEPTQVFRIMVNAALADSSSAAKRLVTEGGVKLDGETIKDPNLMLELAAGQMRVLQVGRRKFVRLRSV